MNIVHACAIHSVAPVGVGPGAVSVAVPCADCSGGNANAAMLGGFALFSASLRCYSNRAQLRTAANVNLANKRYKGVKPTAVERTRESYSCK